jgi:uncharacterized repeat protein (TIGR03809 family)
MGDGTAYGKLGACAQQWRVLAEKRRDYFRELYHSGRWRRYYNEEEFLMRLRDVSRACDRWQLIVDTTRAATAEPVQEAGTIDRRDAA